MTTTTREAQQSPIITYTHTRTVKQIRIHCKRILFLIHSSHIIELKSEEPNYLSKTIHQTKSNNNKNSQINIAHINVFVCVCRQVCACVCVWFDLFYFVGRFGGTLMRCVCAVCGKTASLEHPYAHCCCC